MNASVTSPPPTVPALPLKRRRIRWGSVFLLGTAACVLLFAGLIITAILSFRMGGGARVARSVIQAAHPNGWERQVEFGVGRLPAFLARTALLPFDLEPEARAAVRSFRYADIGVYHRVPDANPRTADATLLTSLRDRMQAKGWVPAVTVLEDEQMVLVFLPDNADFRSILEGCVVVLDDTQMVLVSGAVDPRPLVELAMRHLDLDRPHGSVASLLGAHSTAPASLSPPVSTLMAGGVSRP